MRTVHYKADLCVVGGGLSGLSCSIAAARHGIKTVLIHDRPVLGGNASSEIRMWIGGARGKSRETGFVEELLLENYYRNKASNYSVWDGLLYEKAIQEPNLTLLLNSSCLDATMDGQTIKSVKAWQSNAETFHEVEATYFADCSGDSILAPLSGAEFRYGRESKSEFNESIPPDVADKKTMGMSCLLQIRETDHPVEFIKPSWAYTFKTDDDLPYKDHDTDPTSNWWWLEVGGEWDCLHDTDKCREELLKIAYGAWDHMKNQGDHGVENWDLEWVGFLPGKRESRRYVGEYTVTQNDVEAEGKFDDIVAYAGWPMDDHFPEGFYYTAGHPTIYHYAPSPWGLPLRCMISKNISNLTFAGRNISVTHAALSSSRVMATCSVLGQALGTAIAQAIHTGVNVRKVDIPTLQQTLMEDDCYIPWHEREVSALTKKAKCSHDVVRNGQYRFEENLWVGNSGDEISYTFDKDVDIHEIRLVFDSNLIRKDRSMLCNYPLGYDTVSKVPKTLIKEYCVQGIKEDGTKVELKISDNHQRFMKHPVDWCVKEIRFIPLSTWGDETFRVFGFEIS